MTKQYYIPGKEYEWTKETWEATQARGIAYYGPFNVPCWKTSGTAIYSHAECGEPYETGLNLDWTYTGQESYWYFTVNEEGVEIPECLIPFYGEKESKEILFVDDLEAGKEYIMYLGTNDERDERNIIYWGKNSEVIFITELLYHTYGHIFIEEISHFRNIPEKTREEKLSEKYNVSLDTIKRMMEDGLIQEEED